MPKKPNRIDVSGVDWGGPWVDVQGRGGGKKPISTSARENTNVYVPVWGEKTKGLAKAPRERHNVHPHDVTMKRECFMLGVGLGWGGGGGGGGKVWKNGNVRARWQGAILKGLVPSQEITIWTYYRKEKTQSTGKRGPKKQIFRVKRAKELFAGKIPKCLRTKKMGSKGSGPKKNHQIKPLVRETSNFEKGNQ